MDKRTLQQNKANYDILDMKCVLKEEIIETQSKAFLTIYHLIMVIVGNGLEVKIKMGMVDIHHTAKLIERTDILMKYLKETYQKDWLLTTYVETHHALILAILKLLQTPRIYPEVLHRLQLIAVKYPA